MVSKEKMRETFLDLVLSFGVLSNLEKLKQSQSVHLLISMCFCRNLEKACNSDAMLQALRTAEVFKIPENGYSIIMLGSTYD